MSFYAVFHNISLQNGCISISRNSLKNLLVENEWNYAQLIHNIEHRYSRKMPPLRITMFERKLTRIKNQYLNLGGNPAMRINPNIDGMGYYNLFTNEEGIVVEQATLTVPKKAEKDIWKPSLPTFSAEEFREITGNLNNDENVMPQPAPVPLASPPPLVSASAPPLSPAYPIDPAPPLVPAPPPHPAPLVLPVAPNPVPPHQARIELQANLEVEFIVPLMNVGQLIIAFVCFLLVIGCGLFFWNLFIGANQQTGLIKNSSAIAAATVLQKEVADRSKGVIPFLTWKQKVKFILFRKEIGNGVELFGDKGDVKRGLKPMDPVKIITHGFFSSGNSSMAMDIKNGFLSERQPSINVIVVCWGARARPHIFTDYIYLDKFYNKVVDNEIDAVSDEIVQFIAAHISLEYFKPEDFNLVGHSLGAQISGKIGREIIKTFGVKVERIFGLDPAKPRFLSRPPLKQGISASDASEVYILSSDNFFGGVFLGHSIFYVNGGFSQPGCEVYLFLDLGLWTHKCSHSYVNSFFAASITYPFLGCRCYPAFSKHTITTKDFLKDYFFKCPGNCKETIVSGYQSTKSSFSEVYVEADSKPAFGIKHVMSFDLLHGHPTQKGLYFSPRSTSTNSSLQ